MNELVEKSSGKEICILSERYRILSKLYVSFDLSTHSYGGSWGFVSEPGAVTFSAKQQC